MAAGARERGSAGTHPGQTRQTRQRRRRRRRIMIGVGVVMGVGVVGVGSEILDQVDDDDDGLPRTKKERSAEAPRPLDRSPRRLV